MAFSKAPAPEPSTVRPRGAGPRVEAVPDPAPGAERVVGIDHISSGERAGRPRRARGPGRPGAAVRGLPARTGESAVILRLPPPLDPPIVDPPPAPVVLMPAYFMDPLPFEWPPGSTAAAREPAREPRRPAPVEPPRTRSESYQAAKRFAALCVEILNGYRPPSQLRPLTHPHRLGDVNDQIMRRTVRVRMNPGQAARKGNLVRIRRLLLTEPLAGIAEGVVVLEHGASTWAMAVRFEKADRPGFGVLGWVCTLVQVV
ncbi:Rv3235 family protein [Dactylosporangium sp. NPDC049140]|uniref:Rv3235 family protein n=1 Tax=Dactylosporangium sp. NPDC049140 TaxID=3155647 RepID=UPI0033CB5F2F